MAHYSREIAVTTPPAAAFTYLSRFANAEQWDPSVVEAEQVTPDPVGLGSRSRLVVAFLGAKVPLEYTIIEFEPPRLVVLTAENRSVRSTDTISFGPAASGGTVVRYEADLRLKGPARLAAPLFALALRRLGDRAAAGLHAALTEGADRPRSGRR